MLARRGEFDVVIVPDQGHAPLLTEPKLIRWIAAFVASCDLASAALGAVLPRQPCKLSSLPWWGFRRSNWPNPAQALGRFYYGYYGRFLIERAFVAVNLMIETDQ
jgi:DNA-binding transcriptional LysR family regulator